MQSLTFRFRQHDGPLYDQLYRRLAEGIRSGEIGAGEKLPSKRRLSEDLGISINTVDTAYGMLAAEGYVESRPRSGFVVCRLDTLPAPPPAASPAAAEPPARRWRYDFETAAIDTGLFPFKTWRRIQQDILAGDPSLLNHGHRQGDLPLRRAIATHLMEYRAVRCTPEQVVVGAGIEYLLGMLARMFCTRVFAVENPGYARTARILGNNGVQVRCLPVDHAGLSGTALAQSDAQIAYVTPSHQFPTGVTMPAARRYELLRWAEAAPDRYLIEDDYDSEFRFDRRPLPCLQGMDGADRVIYIGTFSKSLAPAFRIAYMVLPPRLLARWQAEFGFYSCTVSRYEQTTLARFMSDGHFARHLNRLRIAYRRRRDLLTEELRRQLGPVQLSGTHTGLHLLLTMPETCSEQQLVQTAAAQDVRCNGLSAYDLDASLPEGPATVVLGYAGLTDSDIAPAAAALGEAWGPFLRP